MHPSSKQRLFSSRGAKGKEKGAVRARGKLVIRYSRVNSRITRCSIEIVESILLRIADDQFPVGN